jgi:tetratricopeptide (TPR) repeat protein
MNEVFCIPEDRLLELASTRSGRISYAGYNYQCGYAVSRLASMVTSKPLFGLTDYPKHLRYDWGEDLDEVLDDDSVCFTQCKRVDDIGQPAKLADVLLGFAPKWLWTASNDRNRVRFRLVNCDPRFQSGYTEEDARSDVLSQFKKLLATAPNPKSDRFLWKKDAVAVGFEALFDALWSNLSFVYVDSTVIADDPAGVVLFGEAAARDLVLKYGFATGATQKAAIADLRCVINENLIAFDPTNDEGASFVARAPIRIDAADVRLALADKKESHRPPPFTRVDRVLLSKARVQRKEKFLFQSPEWPHVVHGADDDVKFVERDQTDALRQKVRESLIQPLLRGTSNLPALFVIGAPGAGKSTLVRRVVATLVESGEVAAADAGLNLAGGPVDLQSYAEDLQELAGAGRPVLLVLDDPLFEESGWIDLLIHLKQPGFRVAVIAATPDFLHQRYRSQLSKLSSSEFWVGPPSPQEKQRVAEIYGRDVSTFGEHSDDFLVMVAEAESGEQFTKIMDRLWQTLNGGRPFDNNLSFNELPWEVRAFWFVCFLHRWYTLFPLDNLKAALELSGGTGKAVNVMTALERLKSQSGWSIFRHAVTRASAGTYRCDVVSAAHQKIASVAWNQRPMAWFDSEVNKTLAQSSVAEPQSVHSFAIVAATIAKTEPNSPTSFARVLIDHWQKAAAESPRVETRYFCAFVNALILNSGHKLVGQMRETLLARAIGKDGWIAALQLWLIPSDDAKASSFPEDIDLMSLLAIADFSLAPGRAIRLCRQLADAKKLVNAIYHRLFASLEGRLDWEIGSPLLVWLLSHGPQAECAVRLSHILHWLERHDEDSRVRTQYLTFLQGLPATFDDQRAQAVADTADWLKRHDENSEVRTKFLTFLQGLPEAFDEQRTQAVVDTADWLKRHDENSHVRTQYLTFLQGLPAEFDEQRTLVVADTADWLKCHDEDSHVRAKFLTFLQGLPAEFDGQRTLVVADTADWLKRHDEDSEVRTKYLHFLQGLPAEFDEQRTLVVADTVDWLKRHDEDSHVRAKFLTFLEGLPAEFDEQRTQVVADTADWLKRHDEDWEVRTQYLHFLQGLPAEYDEQRTQVVADTADWLKRHDEDSHVRTQYLTFLQGLPAAFDEQRTQVMKDMAQWLERHPGSHGILDCYLPFLLDVPRFVVKALREMSDQYHPSLRLVYADKLVSLSRFDDALAQYDAILDRKDSHQLARRGRAFALQKLGRFSEAEAEFKQALSWARKKKRSEAMFHTSLGEFYLELEHWPDAINSFQEAQKEFPDHFRNHWGIAKALVGTGSFDKAETALNRAMEDPSLESPAKDEIVQLLNEVRLRRES